MVVIGNSEDKAVTESLNRLLERERLRRRIDTDSDASRRKLSEPIEMSSRSLTRAAVRRGRAALLDGRARHRAVGTVDAAVSGLGLEHGAALLALVEPLARIGGHRLGPGVTARRAGERRFENDFAHFALSTNVDG